MITAGEYQSGYYSVNYSGPLGFILLSVHGGGDEVLMSPIRLTYRALVRPV